MSKLAVAYRLLRVKQWVKNVLVFLPLFFAGGALELRRLGAVSLGFAAFCLVSSAVYILNDIQDKERDALHPRKCKRPVASGAVGVKAAAIIAGLLVLCSALISMALPLLASTVLAAYLVMNIAYSLGLKERPLVDVAVIAAGFLARAFYGSLITGAALSEYFLLTIFSVSMFMAFGKRRNELDRQNGDGKDTRGVLRYYNREFLDKSMYVMVALALVFYSMWAINFTKSKTLAILSIPVVIFILIRYSFVVEKAATEGDPSELILSDKPLLSLLALCVALLAGGIYV